MKREYIARYFVVYNNNELEAIAVEKTKMLNAMANEGWELENYSESTEIMPEGFKFNEIAVQYKTILNTMWSKPIEEVKKTTKKPAAKKAK